jgi:hypothetical protein
MKSWVYHDGKLETWWQLAECNTEVIRNKMELNNEWSDATQHACNHMVFVLRFDLPVNV